MVRGEVDHIYLTSSLVRVYSLLDRWLHIREMHLKALNFHIVNRIIEIREKWHLLPFHDLDSLKLLLILPGKQLALGNVACYVSHINYGLVRLLLRRAPVVVAIHQIRQELLMQEEIKSFGELGFVVLLC